MVIFIHSLGSVWQERATQSGTRIWNTTGVVAGSRLQPRSKIAGQVAFGWRARAELGQRQTIAPSLWVTTNLEERTAGRQVQLLVRARRGTPPDWILVTVSEQLVGRLTEDSWDRTETQIVSFSEFQWRQEVMLLMHPFGWLRGSAGAAVLKPDGPASLIWSLNL